MGLGSGIREKPIPDPGSRVKKHRIPADQQHCKKLLKIASTLFFFGKIQHYSNAGLSGCFGFIWHLLIYVARKHGNFRRVGNTIPASGWHRAGSWAHSPDPPAFRDPASPGSESDRFGALPRWIPDSRRSGAGCSPCCSPRIRCAREYCRSLRFCPPRASSAHISSFLHMREGKFRCYFFKIDHYAVHKGASGGIKNWFSVFIKRKSIQ